jgi:uncharacterized membrane protein
MIPFGAFLYYLPTIISPFVSSIKRTNLLGTSILISFLASKLFFEQYAISVWCFFAALMSVIVYVVVKDMKIASKNVKSPSFME